MTLLLAVLWPALAASLVLGGLVGAWAGLPRDRGSVATAIAMACLAALLTAAALTGIAASRAGFWIEIAAICLDGYLVGCAVGAGLSRRVGQRA